MEFEKKIGRCVIRFMRTVKDSSRGEYELLYMGGRIVFYGPVDEVPVGEFEAVTVRARLWAPERVNVSVIHEPVSGSEAVHVE